jgi:two-component system NtrC family sensor kinase
MATTQDEMIAELQRANAELRQEHDSALAREAALSSDLRESLENQTATSDVLKIITRSTFDLQTVLDTLIVTTLRLCNASQGDIWRKDGEVFRHSASQGNLPAYREIEEQTEIRAGRGTLVGRVALERAPVSIIDAWNDPEYEQKEAVYVGQSRSMLGVPLLRDGELIGAFALARTDPIPFTDRQVQLVRAFADQAVIAIENTRLMTEQREALDQQTATTEVLQVINASPGNLAPVFDTILEKAMRLCGAAFGCMYT